MQKGFNSDLNVRGQKFHVQTEDWGQANPYVVTRVFCNGAVMKTIKTPYETIIQFGPVRDSQAIALALKNQHARICDLLIAGKSL